MSHKLLYQPPFSLSSNLMCWLSSILFSILQQKNWKIIFNVELINYLYIIEKINDFIHLKHVVDMNPLAMQLCPFPWPSPCTLSWSSLLTYFKYHHFHNLPKKIKMTLNYFYANMKNKYSIISINKGMFCSNRYILYKHMFRSICRWEITLCLLNVILIALFSAEYF